jgi:hypothetical protein
MQPAQDFADCVCSNFPARFITQMDAKNQAADLSSATIGRVFVGARMLGRFTSLLIAQPTAMVRAASQAGRSVVVFLRDIRSEKSGTPLRAAPATAAAAATATMRKMPLTIPWYGCSAHPANTSSAAPSITPPWARQRTSRFVILLFRHHSLCHQGIMNWS